MNRTTKRRRGMHWPELSAPWPQTDQGSEEYRRQLLLYPTLTVAQERQLVLELLSPLADQHEIRRRLMEGNLRTAVLVARLYLGRGVLLADLIGEANLALVRAAQSFDPAPQRLFRGYAVRRMHWELMHSVAALLRQAGVQDQDHCTADLLSRLPLSLDTPLADGDPWTETWEEEGAVPTLLDILSNSRWLAYEEEAFDRDWMLIERLRLGLALLPPRMRLSLELRYRIGEAAVTDQPRTQREVARSMGVTQSCIAEMQKRGLLSLREYCTSRLPPVHLFRFTGSAKRRSQPPHAPTREPKQEAELIVEVAEKAFAEEFRPGAVARSSTSNDMPSL